MSRNTRRATVRPHDLVDEFAIGAAQRLRCDSDSIHGIVRAVVDYLMEEYPGQDLYIPAPGRQKPPVEELRAALKVSSVRTVCSRYRLDRRTLYRYLEDESDD